MTLQKQTYQLEECIMRLERSHRCVLRQLKHMNSYRYEPKDYEGFIRLRELKAALKELAQNQTSVLDKLQGKDQSSEDGLQLVEQLQDKFRELESYLASYLLDTKGFH